MSAAPLNVLLMAYGSPADPADLEAYYTDIRRGRPPTPELLAELYQRYAEIGGTSPLAATTAAQAEALEAALRTRGLAARVYVGMKHWHPRISEVIARMAADGVQQAVGAVLAPHYSRLSVGDYHARVREAADALEHPIAFHLVESWHLVPSYVAAVSRRVAAALERCFDDAERGDVQVLFTAHSLPTRILEWDDPYPSQLRETAAAVAQSLGIPPERWSTTWQSAGRTPEPWLGPDVKHVVAEHATTGTRSFLVCPVGFVADHMETLWDLDVDLRAHACTLGVHVERSASLNASPDFAQALADVVLARSVSSVGVG